MTKEIKRRPRDKYTKEFVDNFKLEEQYPTSKKFKDLSGQQFSGWKVLKYAGKEGTVHAKYFCECTNCNEGNIQKVQGHHLKKGTTTSCGCAHAEKLTEVMSNSFEEDEGYLKTFRDNWRLISIDKDYPSARYFGYCPSCEVNFNISSSGISLKAGGCKCTMTGAKGYDYNSPAWFYLFKIKNTLEEKVYWKYGVTQKQTVEERNFLLSEGYNRELFFYTAIKDRWCTIRLENEFKNLRESLGLEHSVKGEVNLSGWTETIPSHPNLSEETLVDYFWSLSPEVVPFHTEILRDIEVTGNNSLSSGAVKYFNLDKREREKYYKYCKKNKISPHSVDLTDPLIFDKISSIIEKIRPSSK